MLPATLLSRSELGPGLLLRLHLPALRDCQPGQFFMLRAGDGWAPFLRRPLFPAGIDGETLIVWGDPQSDPGIAWLAARPEGAALDLLGPLGRGFSLHRQQRRLLLVAESPCVGPLLALITPHLDGEGNVGLLLEAPSARELLPPATLPPAVEYHTATVDGSAGLHGDLGDMMPRALAWADAVCAAGSASFLRRLKAHIGELRFGQRRGFAQALAPAHLACGVGACLCCLTDSGRGQHRACVRGPVFDLVDLAL